MEYRHRTTTLTSSLSFVSISTHHRPSNDGALVSPPPPPPVGGSSLVTSSPFAGVGGGGGGGGGGGALDHNIGLNLNTYTAGEDAGRLATMAREFGLANARPPRRQLRRKHAFQAFLRNHPNDDWDGREDIPQSRSLDDPPPPTRPSSETTSSLSSSSATETSPVPAAAASAASSDASTEAETRKRKQRQQRHPPLRFVFSGYSLWLELAQYDVDEDGRGDLDRAMIDAADRFDLGGAIPSPHVTALYGIDCCADAGGGEEEVRRAFREDVPRGLAEEAERRRSRKRRSRKMDAGVGEDEGEDLEEQDEDEKLWPDLDATGMIVDVEFDGVDQGTMDMAWAEVSFATSPAHETLIDALHRIFCRRPPTAASNLTSSSLSSFEEEKKEEHRSPRLGPWVPHLSLCYDNPEGLGPNLTRAGVEELVREQCPTLSSVLDGGDGVKFTRAVSGISLWRTAGTMAEWKCLDRFEFPTVG